MMLPLPVPQQAALAPVPTSRQELSGMMMRRDELKTQLRENFGRRNQLEMEIPKADASTAAELKARLKALEARKVRLETEIEQADDAIANAMAKGITDHEVAPVAELPALPPMSNMPPPGFMIEEPGWKYFLRHSGDTAWPLTLASLVLLGVFMYWRISRSMKNQFAALMAMQSGRLEEIQRSVDTMALEVERVSEGQRFVTKVVGDKLPAGH